MSEPSYRSARAERGVAHVPEGRQVFKTMTVEENLELGAFRRAARARYPENLAMIYALFPQLKEGRKRLAGTLSGGQQQMLAIGRGLAADPQLLMLDEPSMGLAPRVVDQIFDSIFRLHRERQFTILLVEQRAAEALEGCDYGYVLETGRIILAGEGGSPHGAAIGPERLSWNSVSRRPMSRMFLSLGLTQDRSLAADRRARPAGSNRTRDCSRRASASDEACL